MYHPVLHHPVVSVASASWLHGLVLSTAITCSQFVWHLPTLCFHHCVTVTWTTQELQPNYMHLHVYSRHYFISVIIKTVPLEDILAKKHTKKQIPIMLWRWCQKVYATMILRQLYRQPGPVISVVDFCMLNNDVSTPIFGMKSNETICLESADAWGVSKML